jgi:hypothetical protein
LASLFAVADVHAGGSHWVLCDPNRKGAARGLRLYLTLYLA